MITLIVETGAGLANANGLCSVAFADDYHEVNGNTDWKNTKARATLYLSVQPTDGDEITIGDRTYTFQDTLTDEDGNVKIGANIAATQNNLYAAVNLLGVASVNYAASTLANEDASIALFSSNAAVVQAVEGGLEGNEIELDSSDMTNPANRFTSATLLGGKDDKSSAIIRATQYIETKYNGRWKERRTNQLQALSWPRWGVEDADEYLIASDEIPLAIKQACAELALRVVQGTALMPDAATTTQNVVSESVTVGPISTSKSYAGTKTTAQKFDRIDQLLRPFLEPSGRVWRA